MRKQLLLVPAFFLLMMHVSCAQLMEKKEKFTRQDTLRGTITPERAWWDVLHYDVSVTPDYASKSIHGKTTIQYKVIADQHTDYLQVDLQQPMVIDTIFYNHKMYINYPAKPYFRDGNAWFIPLPKAPKNSIQSVSIAYHGTPREAVRPPWDGGWIWKKDAAGRPWMSVACQGLGASVWYPCKDHQGDEPDNGARLTIIVPDSVVAVGNGKLVRQSEDEDDRATYTWEVKNPINPYNLVPYIGYYKNFSETYAGEKGNLTCSYWVLDYNLQKAQQQFRQVPQMLQAFEHWFGPYPFYEDDLKLVESPHLGMEHQSAVAYGNQYRNGYVGKDLSGSGWGLKWDFIIVHESGHEWFANNITTKDIADMWVHEGFTSYSEALFTEFHYGKDAAAAYVQGIRNNIENDKPVIGPYGVNKEGSGDMYYKGSNLLHTIRQLIGDDEKFRAILRGMNKDFYHQTVTSKQVEAYISRESGKPLAKVFDQYLRTTQIPVLELKAAGNKLQFRWTNVIEGFDMPVKLNTGTWLQAKANTWSSVNLPANTRVDSIAVDPNFYVELKKDL
jgi:aminopeptidase N